MGVVGDKIVVLQRRMVVIPLRAWIISLDNVDGQELYVGDCMNDKCSQRPKGQSCFDSCRISGEGLFGAVTTRVNTRLGPPLLGEMVYNLSLIGTSAPASRGLGRA